jgi:hypothetical protein
MSKQRWQGLTGGPAGSACNFQQIIAGRYSPQGGVRAVPPSSIHGAA